MATDDSCAGTSFLRSGLWPAVILLALFWWMAVSAQMNKSPAFDEPVYVVGGYSYWITQDYRLQPENGNLPQRWVTLPLLFGNYQFPPLDSSRWAEGDVWGLGYLFLYRMSNDLEVMLFSGRAMTALLAVGLGALVYGWSRRLFGALGGLVSLILFVFSPSMLAHGSLTTSDLAVTFFLSAAILSFWTMLHHVSIRTILLSALALAATLVSKLSGMAIIPVVILLLVIRLVARRPLRVSIGGDTEIHAPSRQAAVLGFVFVLQILLVLTTIWGFYGFRYSAFGPAHQTGNGFIKPWDETVEGTGALAPAIQFVRAHEMVPEAYIYGFAYAVQQKGARNAFLNGEFRKGGWWYFFPYCLLVKTPIALFVLLTSAGAWAWIIRRSPATSDVASTPPMLPRNLFYDTVPLWVFLAVFWLFAITSRLNIGERHILPTYPAMFILAGAAAGWFRRPSTFMKSVVAASLLWFVIESLSIRPHYLAYFNQIVGGPAEGYHHLVDSSLDWGQELPELKRWLDRQDHLPTYLIYFGMGSPGYYGIRARSLFEMLVFTQTPTEKAVAPLTGGLYCVSATMLQGVYARYGTQWTDSTEQMYRKLLPEVRDYRLVHADPAKAQSWIEEEGGLEIVEKRMEMFDELRLGRLLAYLRKRQPDDRIAYSIFAYRLSNEEIGQAMFGPMP